MYDKANCKTVIELAYNHLPSIPWTFNWGTVTPCICGDKAYPTMDIPANWQLYITKSGERDYDPSAQPAASRRNVHFTMDIAPFRTEVERTFAKIKRFQILSHGRLRLAQDVVSYNMNAVIRVICFIVNFQITHRLVGDDEE